MTKKRLIVAVVAIVVCLSTLMPSAFAFDDVKKTDWFYDAVTACNDIYIIAGYNDKEFGPNDPITLAQMDVILMRTLWYDKNTTAATMDAYYDPNGFFSDVYDAAYQHLAAKGIVNKSYSAPEGARALLPKDRKITNAWREESLTALYRTYRDESGIRDVLAKNAGHVEKNIENPNIPDFGEISEWAKDDILNAYKIGLATGYDETGRFAPKAEITRAEFCQMIYNSGIIDGLRHWAGK